MKQNNYTFVYVNVKNMVLFQNGLECFSSSVMNGVINKLSWTLQSKLPIDLFVSIYIKKYHYYKRLRNTAQNSCWERGPS